MKISMAKILCAIIIFFLTCCSSYKKIPNIVFKTSHGIQKEESVYFLLKYYMYYAPTGLSRFPDGGTVKMIFEKYFLIQESNRRLKVIHEYDMSRFYKILFIAADLAQSGDNIYLKIKYYDKNSIELKQTILGYNLKEKTVWPVDKPVKFSKRDKVSITTIAGHFKKIYDYHSSGLPDPLKYISMGKETDMETIILKKGNRLSRIALIGKYITANDIDMLKRIYRETDEVEIKEIVGPFLKTE